MSRVFGEIRQIAYVTRDLDKAVAFFLNAGVGPWYVIKNRMMPAIEYAGRTGDIEISVGLANSGSLQFEIIEPIGEVRSIYSDFLDRFPDQLMVQHIAAWPTDFAAADERIRAAGYRPVMKATELPSGPAIYYAHPDHPEFIFETAEYNAGRCHVWGEIERGARHWNGSDPVRPWPTAP